jgi:hypothetical protein
MAARVAARSAVNSNMLFGVNDVNIANFQISASTPGNVNGDFAKTRQDTVYFYSAHPVLNIKLTYIQPTDSSVAWLDYITLNARRSLVFGSEQMTFRDVQSYGAGKVTKFIIDHPNGNVSIWNISDPLNPAHIHHNFQSGQLDFTLETDSLLEFVIFDGSNYYSPEFVGPVPHQNLHGLEPVDLMIISPDGFTEAAEELAGFRELHDGISAKVITPEKIYNEFSSGSQDLMAIRDFAKYMYDHSNGEKPKSLLLFGDGSYDNKDRIEDNTNFVPVWESDESLNPVGSFCTDDNYAILGSENFLNISVGRLPVKTPQEAEAVIQKLVSYATDEDAYGSWRNEFCLIADDEDNNLHFNDTEKIAELADTTAPDFNLTKIYLDAFGQITEGDSSFYPDVNEAITKKLNGGVSLINYVGHGKYNWLAQEKILTPEEIAGWNNTTYPIFIAAACEVGRFDDPEINSITEQSLLIPGKGMIAVCAASRATYAGANSYFQRKFYEYLFADPIRSLGTVFMLAKNSAGSTENTRKQILFCDPSMVPAIPQIKVITEAINGQSVLNPHDTVNPGEEVIVTGYLEDLEGNAAYNFNGSMQIKVFERPDTVYTLGNDSFSVVTDFITRDSVLLETQTEVLNGQFAFAFKLPYEMDQDYGTIKISYYAKDYPGDATGHFSELIVGGPPNFQKEYKYSKDFITIYPTLVTNDMQYRLNEDVSNLVIEVFDISGCRKISLTPGNQMKGIEYRINSMELGSGFYVVKATCDEFLQTQKVIKN